MPSSAKTQVDWPSGSLTDSETYGGTITKIENPGSLIPPDNTIITEGETLTTGTIFSSFS